MEKSVSPGSAELKAKLKNKVYFKTAKTMALNGDK